MTKIQKVYMTRQKSACTKRTKKSVPKPANKSKDSISIKKINKTAKALVTRNVRKTKKRRNRKTYDEMVILNKCFKQDPEWNRETVQYLKKTLGLKTAQIYKWGYDRKKLAEKENSEQNLLNFSKGTKNDCFMTDLSIDDYNHAVLKI